MANEVKGKAFPKEQILTAKRYRHNVDIVDAILEDGKSYTLAAVDKMIDEFLKRKVN
ncbi:MAG: hypothetical protein UHU19_07245 [Lachnospiraceae bacterium]|nr:hypothetical protein [Lachnospiraceae bacterium]